MELGLRRPNQDPERDNSVIVSDGWPIAWAALQAFPPMTEIVSPITVDLTLSPDARSASIEALIAALQSAARARLTDADTSWTGLAG
jgi:hypothetical protein